jgi:hypothetical protein
VPHPQRDTGQRDCETLDLDPPDVLQREMKFERTLIAESLPLPELNLAFVETFLNPTQLAVRDVKEVSRSACRIENYIVEEVVLRR